MKGKADALAFAGIIAVLLAAIFNPWVVELILARFMLTLGDGVEVYALLALETVVAVAGVYLIVRDRQKLRRKLPNWGLLFLGNPSQPGLFFRRRALYACGFPARRGEDLFLLGGTSRGGPPLISGMMRFNCAHS